MRNCGAGRVNDVDGRNATVAAIFLGKEQRLLVRVGSESTACERLAIGQRSHLRVLRASCLGQIGHELVVKRLAAITQTRVIPLGGLQQVVRRGAVLRQNGRKFRPRNLMAKISS